MRTIVPVPSWDDVDVPEDGDLVRRADLVAAYQALANRDEFLSLNRRAFCIRGKLSSQIIGGSGRIDFDNDRLSVAPPSRPGAWSWDGSLLELSVPYFGGTAIEVAASIQGTTASAGSNTLRVELGSSVVGQNIQLPDTASNFDVSATAVFVPDPGDDLRKLWVRNLGGDLQIFANSRLIVKIL